MTGDGEIGEDVRLGLNFGGWMEGDNERVNGLEDAVDIDGAGRGTGTTVDGIAAA